MRAAQLLELSEFSSNINYDTLPELVRTNLTQNLFDSFGVALAGFDTPEMHSLLDAWNLPTGDALLWGPGIATDINTALLLNSTALCVLELDEGNKYARGHPGAHVLPVALAEAMRLGVSGKEFLESYLAGYEVASRIARVFQPVSNLHPHGNWGAIGAAAAVSTLNKLSVEQIAQSMDAAAGLALASPFQSALKGSFVRNLWIGSAAINGLNAARLASSGLGSTDDTGTATYGSILGSFNNELLLDELGSRWELNGGYYKQHASCNYSHPAADAAISIRQLITEVSAIDRIKVETHALAVPLDSREPTTRLSAMFSIPHVVAVALVTGSCAPDSFAPENLNDTLVAGIRSKTSIFLDEEIDKKRPAERGARVTVIMKDGTVHKAFAPNSIGDTDFHPFDINDIFTKVSTLLSPDKAVDTLEFVKNIHLSKNISTTASQFLAQQ